ncbi:MAG: primase-helicase zinc-binding domain-containing protein [Desulfobacterales bacterium]
MSETTVIDLVQQFGTAPRRVGHQAAKGTEYAGPCPACGGTDRFRIWDDGAGGNYWCRDTGNGCGKAGDNIQFCIDFLGMDFKTAAAHVGRDLPEGQSPAPTMRPKPQRRERPEFQPRRYGHPDEIDVKRWREKAGVLVERAHQVLLDTPDVLSYLADRGVGIEAVKRFHLGFVPERLFRPRESWGLPVIKKTNGKPKMLLIPRGILIPYFIGEDLVRVRIRVPAEDRSDRFNVPYYILPGSDPAPMLIGDAMGAYVVVEAELDGIAVAMAGGGICGACAMGNSTVHPDAAMHQALSSASCVLNAMDMDTAGAKTREFWAAAYAAKRWPAPVGKDPGDAAAAGADLRTWVLAGLPPAMTMDLVPLDGSISQKEGADGDKLAGLRARPGADDAHQGDGAAAVRPADAGRPEAAEPPQKAAGKALPETMEGDPGGQAAMERLAALLKKYPVRINKGNNGMRLEARQWMWDRKGDVMTEISTLVFFGLFCEIDDHPAEIVDGRNLMEAI